MGFAQLRTRLAGLPGWAVAALLVWLAGRVQPGGLPSPLILPLALAVLTMAPRLGWWTVAVGMVGAAGAGAVYGAAVLGTTALLVRGVQRGLARATGAPHRPPVDLPETTATVPLPFPAAGWRLLDGAAAGAVLLAGVLWAWPRTALGWELDRLAGLVVTALLVLVALPWMRQAVAVGIPLLPALPASIARLESGPPVVSARQGRRVLGLLAVLATGGLDGVRLVGVDAATALRGVAVLVAAHVGGAPTGALVGTAAGVLGLLGGQGSLAGLAWLAMAGTAAGLLRRYGQGAAIAGFVLATAVVCGALPTPTAAAQLVAGSLAALALYAAMTAAGWPTRLARRLAGTWPAPASGAATSSAPAVGDGAGSRASPSAAATGLQRHAAAGGGTGGGPTAHADDGDRGAVPLGTPVAAAGAAPAGWVATSAGGDGGCAGPVATAAGTASGPSWAALLGELARLIEPDPSAWDPREQVAELINDVARQRCLRCPMARTCWQDEFPTTYQAFFDLLAAHERGDGFRPDVVPAPLRSRCPRLPAIAQALAEGLEILRVEMRWRRRMDRHQRLVARQLRELAALVARGPSRPAAPRRPGWRYGMRVGVARTPKDGRWVSGDGYLCRAFADGGRMVLAISDGMGSGRRAAQESRLVLQLLERMLDAGIDAAPAVRLLDTALALRDRESYTTVDLATLDLDRGRVEFVKVGAAPSFVRRARDVQVVAQAAPPAGSVEVGEVPAVVGVLEPGDLVVLISDRVLAAFGDVDAGTAWIRGYLAGVGDDDPRRVA
ncbi:MAG TPA: SpoIIE family protein phosphatase, partial [Thermaerobacter sp.]